MRINHNIAALNTYRQLSINTTAGSKSLEKLSSGFRINRAGDDAAGLAISEKMRGQIRGLDQANRNSQDAISLIQTAEGALNETHSILQRMRELAVQSSSDTNTDADRGEIQKEIDQLSTEITRISTDTEFNTKKLLNGTFGLQLDTTSTVLETTAGVASIDVANAKAGTTYGLSYAAGAYTITDGTDSQSITIGATAAGTLNFSDLGVKITLDGKQAAAVTGDIVTGAAEKATFQIGANEGQEVSLSLDNMSATGLGVQGINLSSQATASAAISTIDDALGLVSAERAMLGAMQNRLEHTINNLGTTSENLTASESRVRDVDMAKEMMEFTKNNILQQAATAMLAQANQQPQGVLQLLQ